MLPMVKNDKYSCLLPNFVLQSPYFFSALFPPYSIFVFTLFLRKQGGEGNLQTIPSDWPSVGFGRFLPKEFTVGVPSLCGACCRWEMCPFLTAKWNHPSSQSRPYMKLLSFPTCHLALQSKILIIMEVWPVTIEGSVSVANFSWQKLWLT